MTSNKNVTARFSVSVSRVWLAVDTLPTSGGTVIADPLPDASDNRYAPGTVVTLTANPASGYRFSNWNGALAGDASPTTITMDANKYVTAEFVTQEDRFTLGVNASPTSGGTVTVYPLPDTDGKYAAGTSVTLTVTPAAGYALSEWTGDLSGGDNPALIWITRDMNVSVQFGPADAPDLVAAWKSASSYYRKTRTGVRGRLTLSNAGTQPAGLSVVEIYLSPTGKLDADKVLMKPITIRSLRAQRHRTVAFTIQTPVGVSLSGMRLIAVLDAAHSVIETKEFDNIVVSPPLQ